jgi:cation transport ATPase
MILSQTTEKQSLQAHAFDRSPAERCREYRYRFSQAMVFGIPVLVLEWAGHGLGGDESTRYIGLFNALLAGWVVYASGLGMVIEGLMILRRRVMPDLVFSITAVAAYLLSTVSLIHLLIAGTLLVPLLFHWCVILLAGWTGFQWWRLHRLSR